MVPVVLIYVLQAAENFQFWSDENTPDPSWWTINASSPTLAFTFGNSCTVSANARGEQVCRGTWTNIVRGV